MNATFQALSRQGKSVLAIAYRDVQPATTYQTTDEHDLVLAGLLPFTDPPLADAAEIVRTLKADGVSIKVLTGDNELVTRHVCVSVRTFMLLIGPISSIYDYLTFYVMFRLFHADETLFHTGWFVESLVTQTLVLFVIRTSGNPLRSRPSLPLTLSVLLTIVVALALPFSPLASLLGFAALPLSYFAFLVVVASTYLLLVEFAKRPILRRHAL